MHWENLKQSVYHEDGSLRDIYVLNATKHDWLMWVDHVNSHYKVTFYNAPKDREESQIDFQVIADYWDGKHDLSCNVALNINHIIVMCYFFSDDEIENDINPKEIQSITDHASIINYLKDVAKLLNKKVILTIENSKEHILLSESS
jgi:hypothetical protein